MLPVPTERTKGILLFPTLSGHIVVGPTAEDQSDRHSPPSVDADVSKALIGRAEQLMPELASAPVALTYAGLRPATEHSDYLVAVDATRRVITLGGIRSTGLSAALGIAEHAAALVAQHWPFVSASVPPLDKRTERRVYHQLVREVAKQQSTGPHPLSTLNLPKARL